MRLVITVLSWIVIGLLLIAYIRALMTGVGWMYLD